MTNVRALCVRICGALVFLGVVLAGAPLAAEWRRVDTTNFIVIGDVSPGQLRDVAVKFEGYREVLGRLLSARATATAVPTVVIVFPHDRAFTPFKPAYDGKPVDVAGVFYQGHDVNYITLRVDGGPQSLQVIFHEYAHLMLSNFALRLPLWLNEGLAEYYSTYESARGGARATLGAPIANHLRVLAERRLLPLEDLQKVDHDSPLYNERDRASVFYAQSWALTHMLLLGEPRRNEKLAAFMRQVALGTSEVEAWRATFADDPVDRDLRNYIHRRVFRAMQFDFPEKVAKLEVTPVALPQPDVHSFLAALYIRQDRSADAENLLLPVLQASAAHAHANTVMARLQLNKGDEEGAAKRLTSIEPGADWFAAYATGSLLTTLVERYTESAPAGYIAAARRHFAVVNRHGELASALAGTVALDLASSEGPTADTRKTMERVRTLAPGRDDFVFLHARLLARQQLYPAARASLGPLLAGDVPPRVRNAARSLMGYIARLEERARLAAERPQPPEPETEAPSSSGRASTAPPSRITYDFRRLQAGEERLEGVLERIDCPRNAPITFHVRDGQLKTILQAKQLSDVDFIAYRDDLKGNVGCGPSTPPMPVYVTWRPGVRATEKVVVAIEFLPKQD